MPLFWNEIRDRALAFSREWATESSEDAEAKSFWDGFFSVFGITRYLMDETKLNQRCLLSKNVYRTMHDVITT